MCYKYYELFRYLRFRLIAMISVSFMISKKMFFIKNLKIYMHKIPLLKISEYFNRYRENDGAVVFRRYAVKSLKVSQLEGSWIFNNNFSGMFQ